MCKAIIGIIKEKSLIKQTTEITAGSAVQKYDRAVDSMLNQKNNRGMTPLMLACERGHVDVAAYLISQGANPLLTDSVHNRSALHHAAVGGHSNCLRLLCSENTTVNPPLSPADGPRPLKDVVVKDIQVGTARYIDQRAFGGLTALHFAAVTGNLEVLMVLLKSGASLLVKTDGEAYIGEEYLVPGSTPLHVAVIIGNIASVHALLVAHVDAMSAAGMNERIDGRGRRAWEGHSRSDLRSVRNSARRLPFHLARERHASQIAQLVDPRVPIDNSLDAAREGDHGYGTKRLATICSVVLQRSLLQWLDECATQKGLAGGGAPLQDLKKKDKKKATKVRKQNNSSAHVKENVAVRQGSVQLNPPFIINNNPAEAVDLPAFVGTPRISPSEAGPGHDGSGRVIMGLGSDAQATPFRNWSLQRVNSSSSAPTTPSRPLVQSALTTPVAMPAPPSTVPAVRPLGIDQMRSLHDYVGLLSIRHNRRNSEQLDYNSSQSRSGTHSRQRSLPADTDLGDDGASPMIPEFLGMGRPMITLRSTSLQTGTIIKTSLHALREKLMPGEHDHMHREDLQLKDDVSKDGDGDHRSESDESEDMECGVCLDKVVQVAFSDCQHSLCIDCARHLTQQEKRPPCCPFCRRMIVGFIQV